MVKTWKNMKDLTIQTFFSVSVDTKIKW